MSAFVWRDEQNELRCRRSPGGTDWYVLQSQVGSFQLAEALPAAGETADGGVSVGRIDPETAEQIIKFLLREQRQG